MLMMPQQGHALRPMAARNTIREDNIGFFLERERYIANAAKGDLLPALRKKEKAYSFNWPVDMSNSKMHLSNFFGEQSYSAPEHSGIHTAIDIQAPPGTKVRPVEKGIVIFCCEHLAYSNLVDIYVYSESYKLLWLYGHIEKDSVPERIISQTSPDAYEEIKVTSGAYWEKFDEIEVDTDDVIGEVGSWGSELRENVSVPSDVERVYGRAYHHLHLRVRYAPNGKTDLWAISLTDLHAKQRRDPKTTALLMEQKSPVEVLLPNLVKLKLLNPLLLLRKLYNFPDPDQTGASAAPFTNETGNSHSAEEGILTAA